MNDLTVEAKAAGARISQDHIVSMYRKHLQDDSVDEQSSFYQNGGTSLTATLLLADILSQFGIKVSFDVFDKNNTPASLALELGRHSNAGGTPTFQRHVKYERGQFALSAPQSSRCWYHAGFRGEKIGDEGAYNVPYASWITGRVDVGALEKALRLVAARHDSLGMSFAMNGGRVVQTHSNRDAIEFRVEPAPPSIRQLYDAYRSDAASVYAPDAPAVNDFHRAPFDWTKGETVRCVVYAIDESTSLVLMAWNHLAFDFISKGIFVRDVGKVYDALIAGRSGDLPRPTQYRDYLEWERGYRESAAYTDNLSYWVNYFSGSEPDVRLPTRGSRSEARADDAPYRQERKALALEPALAAEAKRVARELSVTPYVLLLTAFAVALAKLSQYKRLTIGTQIANRARHEVLETCGCFAQPVGIVADLDPQVTVETALRAVHKDLSAAIEHQPVSLPAIADALRRSGSRRFHPLFQCVFEYFDIKPDALALAGASARELLIPYHFGRTSNELAMLLWDREDSVSGVILYAAELYDAAAIERVAAAYVGALRAALENPRTTTVQELLNKVGA